MIQIIAAILKTTFHQMKMIFVIMKTMMMRRRILYEYITMYWAWILSDLVD